MNFNFRSLILMMSLDICRYKSYTILKNKISTGWNEIPLGVMKRVEYFIAEPLSILVSQSINQKCFFPENLKFERLNLIF